MDDHYLAHIIVGNRHKIPQLERTRVTTKKSNNRANEILQALATMLESHHGKRITTAALAAEVGVSEAALYRHFPSKARMFEGLIEFIEQTIFARINKILQDETEMTVRIQLITHLIVGFAEKNPGISRILNGDALQGEQERLRSRVAQIFSRLETQFKQILRESTLKEGYVFRHDEAVMANMLVCLIDGKINQFVRSEFKHPPTSQFNENWAAINDLLLL